MRLSHCFIDLIAYATYWRTEEAYSALSIEEMRSEMQKRIDKSLRLFEENSFSHDDYDLARFAVFVWIDETIMQSTWDGKAQWKKNLLQREYYKTSGGGVEFYNRLERLEPEQNEVREIYYLCLVSGFKGMYGTSNEDTFARDAIKSKNLKRLTGTMDGPAASAGEMLFSEAYGNDLKAAGIKSRRFFMSPVSAMITFSPVAVFLFLFILYRFILNNEMITKLVP